MSNQIFSDSCAACGDQWKTRKWEVFSSSAKTRPMIFGMQLLSDHGKKRIKLMFCDKHGNNPGFRNVIKYMNGSRILKIRNVIKNSWRSAEKIGVVV